ncbi:response regulator [Paenibacillus sp. TAB 01]|uniref:response regulator n=1 Tax=Paenibacillus sp. TAB 01 TaxID=3368988 RepID=UPI0037505AAF
MTIKMLIVDDEPIICRGIRETIPWDQIGVEVAGEAYDGLEALEAIGSGPVDLVLTDVHMDGMDGLALSKMLREQYPDTRIIILSGYDDFEYARQAIRIGVEDYLLKPVDVDELMGMVKRIADELSHEAEQRKERQRESWLSWLKQSMQNSGVLLDGDLPEGFVPAAGQRFRMIASQQEDYALWAERTEEEQRQAARRQWEQEVREALACDGQEAFSFFYHPNLLITLCVELEPAGLKDPLAALSEVKGPLAGNRLYFGVSPVFQALEETYTRGEEAVAALQLGIAQGERSVLLYGEAVVPPKPRGMFAPVELEKQLVNLLFNGTEEELEAVLRAIMTQSKERGYLPADIAQGIKELKILIQRRLRTSGIDVSGDLKSSLSGEPDPHVYNSYRSLEMLMRRELLSLFSLIHSSVAGKNHWTIERVRKYIESHHSHDLKASEVAAWLKITPNYFSIIFNQHFGKGFAEYLNEVRIEHAKGILRGTHDRVFEIAEKVGYNDYKYFCSIFKSYTGVTPTQYRKLAERTPV